MPQAKHARMRRAAVVAVLVIGAVLARVYGPRNWWFTYTTHTEPGVLVARGIAPLNVVMFWLLVVVAAVVAATALRSKARTDL